MQNTYQCYKTKGGIMHIKKVIEYDYNYAQYLVTDGKNDVKCVCMSVPLPNGRKPERGLEITKIYAFSVDGVVVNKIIEEKNMRDEIKKELFDSLGYKLKGRILDSNNSIVQVFNFEIDLEYDYPDGLGEEFKNGDYVEFSVDRLDCIIENYY